MSIASKYDSVEVEKKWYAYWMENGFFDSVPDEREAFTIVIPPPNVTGVLHMGHMLNNTIQDVLVRKARMMGKNACWVPGTDHASIATEAKVVAKLKEQGIDKKDLTREEFLSHAWEWKEKHGGIILEQLKKLGASCDWKRTSFTMDDNLSSAVIKVFVDLFNKGNIYRGVRMVNWDPSALTALSDEEVIYKEVQSKLYYCQYKIEGTEEEYITIATTRPETILGDTAICIHPDDERFKKFHGKRAIVPLVNRAIPIIVDTYVDPEFGTGALKITPAHDVNDYNLGIKYNLEVIDIFNDNGTLNEKAQLYIGEDRFVVRKKIEKALAESGNLVKVEEYVNKVGFSERTDAVIEPKLSLQWFCKMTNLAQPALEHVMNDTIHFYPSKYKNTYKHWMENVKDWCISRQLWWGQRIPAYFYGENINDYVVANSLEEALILAKQKTGNEFITTAHLRQDEDVLDTWFSSWLWPISVFDGIHHPKNKDISYYYPTNDLVTAPEILFFWVARMIMAGYEYLGDMPFKNVYLTGIVRDKQRRKMSKSLGNSPEPLELIEKYGADGVRIGMLFCSPAGNDLLFDESLCEQGRNFSNKIWNAFRLVKGWEVDKTLDQPAYASLSIACFKAKFQEALRGIEDNYGKYRLSEALMGMYKLVWDDFCAWYLEMIKPAYQQPIDEKTYQETLQLFEDITKVIHPYMPFISEEIWSLLTPRKEKDVVMIASYPSIQPVDTALLGYFDYAKEVIMGIRTIRNQKNIPQKEALSLVVVCNESAIHNKAFDAVISKMCHLSQLTYSDSPVEGAASFMVQANEFFVPLSQAINKEEEIIKLEQELQYAQQFLSSVKKKLENEKFMASAPKQVVDIELKKQSDTQAKIDVLEKQLKELR